MLNLEKFKNLDLHKYDFKIFIDKSGSMSYSDCPEGSRWKQAHRWSKEIAYICNQFDDDGIDVYMFDNDVKEYNNVTDSKVDEIFRKISPDGGTSLVPAIKAALPSYFESSKSLFGMFSKKVQKPSKPIIVIVFTDGEPFDKSETMNSIIHITKQISSREEIGFSFLQVGNSSDARSFLKVLDDQLESKGAKFDIVNTINFDESRNMSSEDILLAALTK